MLTRLTRGWDPINTNVPKDAFWENRKEKDDGTVAAQMRQRVSMTTNKVSMCVFPCGTVTVGICQAFLLASCEATNVWTFHCYYYYYYYYHYCCNYYYYMDWGVWFEGKSLWNSLKNGSNFLISSKHVIRMPIQI